MHAVFSCAVNLTEPSYRHQRGVERGQQEAVRVGVSVGFDRDQVGTRVLLESCERRALMPPRVSGIQGDAKGQGHGHSRGSVTIRKLVMSMITRCSGCHSRLLMCVYVGRSLQNVRRSFIGCTGGYYPAADYRATVPHQLPFLLCVVFLCPCTHQHCGVCSLQTCDGSIKCRTSQSMAIHWAAHAIDTGH